jgi:hypothetical protein
MTSARAARPSDSEPGVDGECGFAALTEGGERGEIPLVKKIRLVS